MPREKEGFRDTLGMLNEAFPDKNVLTLAEAARWAGLDSRTVIRRFGAKFHGKKNETKYICKADLARAVCK